METDRCIIQMLDDNDYNDVKGVYVDEKVREFLGGAVSDERYDNCFKEMIDAEDGSLYWVVRLKENNEFIGLISIDDHHDGVYKELSYQFIPSYWGKGYAFESTREVLNYASKELKLKKIVAETQVANKSSCNLLSKLGMKINDKVFRFNAEQYIFLLDL